MSGIFHNVRERGCDEENKNKENAFIGSLILTFSRWEKGLIS